MSRGKGRKKRNIKYAKLNREEMAVANACGGKPGSHGSKVILLSHA